MTLRTKLRHIAALFAVAMLLPAITIVQQGCAKAPPNLSPQGQRAWQALQVVQEAKVFRDVAVAGEQNGVIPTETTRLVVEWHKAFLQTIAKQPEGWKPEVLEGLKQLRGNLPQKDRTKFEPYITLIETLLQGVL